MTHGDSQTCKCPACKKLIVKPIAEERPMLGTILEGKTLCPYCKCALHFWARWTVTIELERESKTV